MSQRLLGQGVVRGGSVGAVTGVGRRAVLLGGAALLAGCAAGPGVAPAQPGGRSPAPTGVAPAPTGPRTPPDASAPPAAELRSATVAEMAALADRLNGAVAARDPDVFAAAFGPGATGRAGVLYGNALALGGWRAEAGDGVLVVRTRVAQEPATTTPTPTSGWASAALVPAVDAQGRVAALADRAGDHPVVWTSAPVRVLTEGRVALVSAESRAAAAAPWLAAAADAAARLAPLDFSAWRAAPWDGSLTAELPADLLQFGEDAGVGAYVRLRGPDEEPRIVCSPAERPGLDEQGRRELLAHEAVHAVTRSPGRAAPLWAIEGYAERIAERVHPALAARNEAELRAASADGLPSDADLRTGAAAAYPRSAAAVRAAEERWGEARVAAWFADWAGAAPPPAEAFAAELSGALSRLRRAA